MCALLDGIQQQQAAKATAEEADLAVLDVDASRQEALVKQLDGQRAAIVSLLQRGRDLQHHSNAPGFLHDEVQQLEQAWNKTNEMAYEKLKKLKSSVKLWSVCQSC